MTNYPQPVATMLHVKTQFEGFHCWPEAPDDVAFLRTLHRHQFGVQLTLCLPAGSTRQFEFFQVQRDLSYLCARLAAHMKHFNCMSCEDMAARLGDTAADKPYAWREFLLSISVSEDEENSATVVFGNPIHEDTPAVYPGKSDQPAS